MDSKSIVSEDILYDMYNLLHNEKCAGKIAMADDLLFITDGSWLKDAAVIDVINNRKGAWDVYLVFAHYLNPLQLIVRNITRCFSEQKAKAASFYMRKEAAKDRRGTLSVSIKDFDLCNN